MPAYLLTLLIVLGSFAGKARRRGHLHNHHRLRVLAQLRRTHSACHQPLHRSLHRQPPRLVRPQRRTSYTRPLAKHRRTHLAYRRPARPLADSADLRLRREDPAVPTPGRNRAQPSWRKQLHLRLPPQHHLHRRLPRHGQSTPRPSRSPPIPRPSVVSSSTAASTTSSTTAAPRSSCPYNTDLHLGVADWPNFVRDERQHFSFHYLLTHEKFTPHVRPPGTSSSSTSPATNATLGCTSSTPARRCTTTDASSSLASTSRPPHIYSL